MLVINETATSEGAMREGQLSMEESEILDQVLQNALATLELEILHTDHAEFKASLKKRRAVIEGLRARLLQPD